MDYEDLDQYNGDTEHDMWVEFTYHENTGELTDSKRSKLCGAAV